MPTTDPALAPAESWIARSDAYAQPYLEAWARYDLILRQGFLDPLRLRNRVLTAFRCAGEPLRAA